MFVRLTYGGNSKIEISNNVIVGKLTDSSNGLEMMDVFNLDLGR